MAEIKEGQIWRKQGPHDWLKISQILDPEYPGHDGGLHGATILCYPPQLKGIQCRGGKRFFIADCKNQDGTVTSWEDQIVHNRYLLANFRRGDKL